MINLLGNMRLIRLFGSKIRIRLTLVWLALVIIPLVIIILATNILFGSYIQSNAISQLEYSNLKIGERYKRFNRDLNDLTARIITNNLVQQSLKDNLNAYEAESLVRYLKQYGSNTIDSLLYMDNKGNIYNTSWHKNMNTDGILKSIPVRSLKKTYAKLVWTWHRDELFGDDGQQHLFIARYIRHLDLDLEPGILILKINSSAFDEIVGREGLMEDSSYLLMDQNAEIVFAKSTWEDQKDQYQIDHDIQKVITAKQDADISRLTNMNRIILFASDIETQWKIATIVPIEAIMKELRQLQYIMSVIVAVAVIGTIVVSFIYTNRFTHPINSIVQAMRHFRQGDFGVRLDLKSHDEFEEIGHSFNQMAIDIIELLKTIQKDQETIKVTELNSLIYQINPHFIYNTLDNIYMLSRLSGDKKTGDLIQALSKLLRISLSKGQSVIELTDEFEHAINYLNIQKLRYEGLFDFQARCDSQVGQCRIIKFILQPLIENSITHGFRHIESGGMVKVLAVLQNGSVVINVEDNGIGIDDQARDDLNGLMNASPISMTSRVGEGGYGISNVAARLKLFYGSGASLEYTKLPNGGTRCTINIQQNLMLARHIP